MRVIPYHESSSNPSHVRVTSQVRVKSNCFLLSCLYFFFPAVIVVIVGALLFILDYSLTFWYSCAVIISCLIISFASYTKIFYSLCHRRIQTQDRVQQQPRAPNALNIARYKKAVYSALWVQLALVVCYVPYIVVAILIASSETYPSQLIVSSQIVLVFVYFNSSLNPFLYCWKISEVRQAVIETIRFFFLQLKYCPTSFVATLVLGFISLCYLKRIILIDKMNVDVFVTFKSYGSEWVK